MTSYYAYEVQPGDTLSGIALKLCGSAHMHTDIRFRLFGSAVPLGEQGSIHEGRIYPGDLLVVPGAWRNEDWIVQVRSIPNRTQQYLHVTVADWQKMQPATKPKFKRVLRIKGQQ